MNEKGFTLQTLIVLAALAVGATLAAVVLTRAIAGGGENAQQSARTALQVVSEHGCDWDYGFMSENTNCYKVCWGDGNRDILLEPMFATHLFTVKGRGAALLSVDQYRLFEQQGDIPSVVSGHHRFNEPDWIRHQRPFAEGFTREGDIPESLEFALVEFRHPGVLDYARCGDTDLYSESPDWADGYIFAHRGVLANQQPTIPEEVTP